jgi:hypothetical protein
MTFRPLRRRFAPSEPIGKCRPGRGARRASFLSLITAGVVMASVINGASAAEARPSRPPPPSRNVKAAPERPPASPNAVVDNHVVPPKPNTDARRLAPLANIATPWSVSLTASSLDLWPRQYSTLTATASRDVGPTPYYIRIVDLTTHATLATCGFGTTCSVPVTQPARGLHYYEARITTWDGSSTQAASRWVLVSWKYYASLTLTTTASTLPVGRTTTLTATSSDDVGPSPFWIEIFDLDTATRLSVCGWGKTCSASVSQGVATTHKFVAYVSDWSTTSPPTGVIETSDPSWITWNNSGWSVSLSAGNFGQSLTAVANRDVGPTPYWIEIFNADSGQRVGLCGSGTVCTTRIPASCSGQHMVAFVSASTPTFLPQNIQASSATVTAVSIC